MMGSTTDLSYSERVLEEVQTAVSSKTNYVHSPKLDISCGLVVSFCDHRMSVVCQQMGLVRRKLVFRVSDKASFKQLSSATETS